MRIELPRVCPICENEFMVDAKANRRRYCFTCKPDNMTRSELAAFYTRMQKEGKALPSRSPRLSHISGQDPTDVTVSQLTTLRLRIEAAKPLLRLGLMGNNLKLVQAALNELEGLSDELVIDIRAMASVTP